MRYSNAHFGRSILIDIYNPMWACIRPPNMEITIYVISRVFNSSESPDMGFTFTFAPNRENPAEISAGVRPGLQQSWSCIDLDRS